MLCENINRVYKYQYSLHLSIRLGHLEIHILALSNLNFDVRTFKLDVKQGGMAGSLFLKLLFLTNIVNICFPLKNWVTLEKK